jgi:hypothetical protein
VSRAELVQEARALLARSKNPYFLLVERTLLTQLVDLAEGHPSDDDEIPERDLPDLSGLAV